MTATDGRALGARPDRRASGPRSSRPARGWAIGLGLATLLAVPHRDRARPQRPRRPRVSRPGRVSPADPVRGADPAALPDARPDPPERGLPRGLRRLLADSRADDVRRPRRRPRGHRHRTVVRRCRSASASGASRCRARCPYIATGMRIASAVALILAFTAELFMGTPGLGKPPQLRAVLRAHDPALRPRARHRRARASARISCSRRSSAAPCAGTRRSGLEAV